MNHYLQTDPRWSKKTFGPSKLTLGKYGCLITCLAMFDGRTPDVVADILTNNNCFTADGLLYSDRAAKVLGLEYAGKTTARPAGACIAETGYYKPGTPQHFYVLNPDGSQLDPLGKTVKYPVVSYRLFKPKVSAPAPLPVGTKFPLYKERKTGKIYFRGAAGWLEYIGDPVVLGKIWGANVAIDREVEDIHELGFPIYEDVIRDNEVRAGQITQLEGAINTLNGQITALQGALTDCQLNQGSPEATELIKSLRKFNKTGG